MTPTKNPSKKRVKRSITSWKVHIKASYNNTIVTFSEDNWNVFAWSTAWSSWFKGARKSTPYAWQVAAEKAAEKAKAYWLNEVIAYIKGIWPWREQAVRWLLSSWIEIRWIVDITPIPHNGCRQKKARRV